MTHDDVHCLVIAKAPEPGRTKTRLATTIGHDAAAALSAAAVLDTLAACTAAFGTDRCHLSLDGDLADGVGTARITQALEGWTVRPQARGDFAHRLAHAHQELHGSIVQLGTDTPQVTPDDLTGVVAQLDIADAVLGPAADGGWWVLALRDSRHAACLVDVPMSSSSTGDETLAALQRRGLTVALAPVLRDVDVVADAEAVAALAPSTEFGRIWRSHQALA